MKRLIRIKKAEESPKVLKQNSDSEVWLKNESYENLCSDLKVNLDKEWWKYKTIEWQSDTMIKSNLFIKEKGEMRKVGEWW